MIAGDPDHGMHFALSPGQASDCRIGKELIANFAFPETVTHLVMDKGYSCYETLEVCAAKNIEAVVPPKGITNILGSTTNICTSIGMKLRDTFTD